MSVSHSLLSFLRLLPNQQLHELLFLWVVRGMRVSFIGWIRYLVIVFLELFKLPGDLFISFSRRNTEIRGSSLIVCENQLRNTVSGVGGVLGKDEYTVGFHDFGDTSA